MRPSVLMRGLRRLEYRGYDSAGVAVVDREPRPRWCAAGASWPLSRSSWRRTRRPARVGIGHTRWATHGRPSDENAHPHRVGSVSVVHNGIIENHAALRDRLKAAGRAFTSQTDTEVIAHLVDEAAGRRGQDPGRGGSRRRSSRSRARTPSRCFPTGTRTRSSRPRTPRRWSSAWATARASSPPTPRPSSSTRAR